MKRKILCILLSIAIVFSFCSCGSTEQNRDNNSVEESSTNLEGIEQEQKELEKAEEVEQPKEIIKYNLNDVVSTDILDFKLESAEFSYYASSVNNDTYCKPVENTNGIFAINKGHTFVCITFEITNTDRASISIADYSGFPLYFDVIYNNEHFDIRAFDLNNTDGRNYLSLQYALIGNSDKLIKSDSNNKILNAGETITIQTLGQINTEPNNLTDSFEILIRLLNSTGETEEFIYTIDER